VGENSRLLRRAEKHEGPRELVGGEAASGRVGCELVGAVQVFRRCGQRRHSFDSSELQQQTALELRLRRFGERAFEQ
jgi:hypothetical protein